MADGGDLGFTPDAQQPMGGQPTNDLGFLPETQEEQYGGIGSGIAAGFEGAAKGLAGPIATGAERLLGVSPQGIQGRAAQWPFVHGASEMAGLVAPAVASFGGSSALRAGIEGVGVLPKAMTAVEELGARALGLGAPESIAAKIGSAAVKGAIGNMVFQTGDELSKHILGDPNSVETALPAIGLAGLIGAGAGGVFGSVSPLWKAVSGGETAQVLSGLAGKTGGIEGVIPDHVHEIIQKSGLKLDPEIIGAMASDPKYQQMFQTLNQSDTTASGRALQEAYKGFRRDAGDSLITAAGRSPDQVGALPDELSKNITGANIGNTLAKEWETKVNPTLKEFDELKGRYAGADLTPDEVIPGVIDAQNPYVPGPAKVIQGTASKVADKISQLAEKEGWTMSPDSDIMREVNRAIKQVKNLNTIGDLTTYGSRISENTASTLPFGQQTPLSRAGEMMKGILRDAEGDEAIEKLGADAPDLALRYKAARSQFRDISNLKGEVEGSLGARAKVGQFAKMVRGMAKTDAEAIANRLSGTNDANILRVLQQHFPETAELVKGMHVDNALKAAANAAKEGENISASKLLQVVGKMSPEVRNFAFPPEALTKINAVGQLLDHFNSMPHNFSNTARTVDKLFSQLPGGVLTIASLLMGHNPLTALVIGPLVKAMGKDIPDAIKLSTLKFLGSAKPIESEGFHAATHLIDQTQKGAKLVDKAIKSLFKGGAAVLSEKLNANDNDIKKLDKGLKVYQDSPDNAMNVAGKTSYYMPEHGQALSATAQRAIAYLNAQRPSTAQTNPLDGPRKPTQAQDAQYRNALALAQQPLGVISKIQAGTVTPKDVALIQTVYPALYTRIRDKMFQEVIDTAHKGQVIPYKVRLGMSQFLQQPLDSTMTPQAILAAQPMPKTPQQPQGPQGKANGSGSKALAKLPGMYQTREQTIEAHRQKD